jgi:hypothetical protein
LISGLIDEIPPSLLEKEPPLTQADMDLFIRFINPAQEMDQGDPDDNQTTLLQMEKYIISFAEKNNTTVTHLFYITEKIPEALLYSLDNSYPIQTKLRPNPSEVKILMQNKDKILKALVPRP